MNPSLEAVSKGFNNIIYNIINICDNFESIHEDDDYVIKLPNKEELNKLVSLINSVILKMSANPLTATSRLTKFEYLLGLEEEEYLK